jgi:hypothetical protein
MSFAPSTGREYSSSSVSCKESLLRILRICFFLAFMHRLNPKSSTTARPGPTPKTSRKTKSLTRRYNALHTPQSLKSQLTLHRPKLASSEPNPHNPTASKTSLSSPPRCWQETSPVSQLKLSIRCPSDIRSAGRLIISLY